MKYCWVLNALKLSHLLRKKKKKGEKPKMVSPLALVRFMLYIYTCTYFYMRAHFKV